MGYIEKNLLANEDIVYRARLHLIIFSFPVLWLAISIGSFIAIKNFMLEGWMPVPAVFFILFLLHGLVVLIKFLCSEFAVTNQRLMVKTGLIKRDTFELLLPKLEGIQVHQSIPGRILGFGTIVASGTGGLSDTFEMISSPLEFRKQIQKCAAEHN